MASNSWEVGFTTPRGDDGWDTPLETPKMTPLLPMSIPFLSLPQEIRDMIYRQLLSTKYSKFSTHEPFIDSLLGQYKYNFHPSILCTNKQIEFEARRILYTENLLVRINSCGAASAAAKFKFYGSTDGLPVLATGDCARRFRYHLMEVTLLRDYSVPDGFPSDPDCLYSENCFVVASDDLPGFCRIMLIHNMHQQRSLSKLIIAMEISHEVNEEDTKRADDDKAKVKTHVDNLPMSPRTRRLLEPFRNLHSLEAVHIEGPVDPQYKIDLIADMCRPEPSEEELCDRVITTYEDALCTYHAGHTSSAITMLKHANDVLEEYQHVSGIFRHGESWENGRYIQFYIWYNLAEACFQNRDSLADVKESYVHINTALYGYADTQWDFSDPCPKGREVAMAFHLLAEVHDVLDILQADRWNRPVNELKAVVGYIEVGLRHDPDNEVIKKQLRKKKEELRNAKYVEKLMGISDRMNEQNNMCPVRGGEEVFEARVWDVIEVIE